MKVVLPLGEVLHDLIEEDDRFVLIAEQTDADRQQRSRLGQRLQPDIDHFEMGIQSPNLGGNSVQLVAQVL